MSSSSPSDESNYLHRQGSLTSLPDEDDPVTISRDLSITQPKQELSSEARSNSFDQSNGYSITSNHVDNKTYTIEKEYQTSTIDLATEPDTADEDNANTTIGNSIQSWNQLLGETSANNQGYQDTSQSDTNDDVTTSFGFEQQQQETTEEINPETDYESLVRSKQLFYDPNPHFIRKPQMITPLIYKQNIQIKFLKPPPVPQGPLIIREVRPPQPPPPPPLIIRKRPLPPLSPPPIILREKPPRVPALMTAQYLTKTLPPLPPPPRSVIIEKLPPLPPKPRDVIIERWIPYQSSHKRKVIVQRAEEPKPYPPPRNIIITYDKVEAQIVRQFQRIGITSEDPQKYSARYGDSLLDTKQLIAQAKELGITEDISPPNLIDNEFQEQTLFQKRSPSSSFSNGGDTTDKPLHADDSYASTYENLVNRSSYDSHDENNFFMNNGEDLSTQLAQYGLTIESIPF